MDLEPAPQQTGPWLEVLPERARRAMAPAVWAYVQAGAGEGLTAAEANAAWRDVRFRTRVLRGVGQADLRTTFLGVEAASPIAIAPTAMQRAVHPTGERAMAAGASEAGVLHVVSANSGTRFAEPTPWGRGGSRPTCRLSGRCSDRWRRPPWPPAPGPSC